MHIRRGKNEIHGDPRSLLRTPSRQVKQFGFGAKKTNILVTFSHYTIICFEQYAPPLILLFGTILLLNLTDLPPYTFIWPIRLFGTQE